MGQMPHECDRLLHRLDRFRRPTRIVLGCESRHFLGGLSPRDLFRQDRRRLNSTSLARVADRSNSDPVLSGCLRHTAHLRAAAVGQRAVWIDLLSDRLAVLYQVELHDAGSPIRTNCRLVPEWLARGRNSASPGQHLIEPAEGALEHLVTTFPQAAQRGRYRHVRDDSHSLQLATIGMAHVVPGKPHPDSPG